MKSIAIIGHSHVVAILDGIGCWRKAAHLDQDCEDKSYTAAFQDWYSVNTAGKLFEILPKKQFEAFRGAKVSPITSAGSYTVATLTRLDNGSMQASISPDLQAFLNEVAEFDVVISVLHGGEHVKRGIVNDMPEYDFAPYEEGLTDYYPIDSSYIAKYLAQDIQTVGAPLLAMCLSLKKARLLHVAPPPPLKDPSAAKVYENLDDLVRRYGFVRPALRLKWYSRYLASLRSVTARLGITLVEPNDHALTVDGFLNPEFAEGLTHGNARYGELMAGDLARLIQE
jgi:hypothetical protein